MALPSLKQRWQKEAVKKADLVSPAAGSRALGWVPGGGGGGGGRRGGGWLAGSRQSRERRVHQHYQWLAEHAWAEPQPPAAIPCCLASLTTLRLPSSCLPSPPVQQLLKAVVFFAGAIIVSRNFGDAFAI